MASSSSISTLDRGLTSPVEQPSIIKNHSRHQPRRSRFRCYIWRLLDQQRPPPPYTAETEGICRTRGLPTRQSIYSTLPAASRPLAPRPPHTSLDYVRIAVTLPATDHSTHTYITDYIDVRLTAIGGFCARTSSDGGRLNGGGF